MQCISDLSLRRSHLAPDVCLIPSNHGSGPSKRSPRSGQAIGRTSEDRLATANALRFSYQKVRRALMKASSPLVEARRSPRKFLFLSVQPAFPLVRLSLPLVGNLLALAGHSLALVCDAITLVGDAIARSFVGLDSIRPLSPTAPDFGVYIALVLSRVPVGLLVLCSRRLSSRAHDSSSLSPGQGRVAPRCAQRRRIGLEPRRGRAAVLPATGAAGAGATSSR